MALGRPSLVRARDRPRLHAASPSTVDPAMPLRAPFSHLKQEARFPYRIQVG